MRALYLAVAAAAIFSASAVPAQPADMAAKLDASIAGAHRGDAARARDPYRHPKETLLFFGLKPGMTVVEILPGAGWYTDILAPALKDSGRLIAAHYSANGSAGQKRQRETFIAHVQEQAALFGPVAVTSFAKGNLHGIAAPGSADMVLTFRNVHNWAMGGFAEEAFASFYQVLKPGGVLGVVEHRLPEDRSDPRHDSGYMKMSEIVRLAQAAGFKLDATSEINANPKDTADHPKGVWTLPPVYALGDTDRAKYAAIGESDRMTLRFVKPK